MAAVANRSVTCSGRVTAATPRIVVALKITDPTMPAAASSGRPRGGAAGMRGTRKSLQCHERQPHPAPGHVEQVDDALSTHYGQPPPVPRQEEQSSWCGPVVVFVLGELTELAAVLSIERRLRTDEGPRTG